MHTRRLASVSFVTALAAIGLTAPAQAAFPGRNGKIAVAFFDDPGGGVGPARLGIGLLRADRGPTQHRREAIACTDDRVPPRECLRDYATPAFSPDGRRLAFDAGGRIAVVRTGGGGLRLLPAGGTDPANPAWSPNGKRIVFDAARSGATRAVRDLYVVAADGSGRAKRIVRNAGNPSWSVDGLLAFERPAASVGPIHRRIWVSRSDGSRAHVVSSGTSKLPDFSHDPDFSPNGARLVYQSGARDRLVVVGTNGRGAHPLAASTAGGARPAWSPDGRQVAWYFGGIHVARIDGTHERMIANDRMGPMSSFSFSSYAPSWQPLPRR